MTALNNVNQYGIWIAPITAVVSIFITAFLSYILGFKSQVKLSEKKERESSYGKLMGLKFSLSQLYVSRFEAYIFSDFHERRMRLAGVSEDSHDFNEAKRWMQKSEELALSISEKQEYFFNTIGLVNATFPETNELNKLIENVYNFKNPCIYKIQDNIQLAQIEEWKNCAVKQLQEIVKKEITKPIDDLLVYLKKQL